MGRQSVVNALDPALRRFALRLQEAVGAERVLLYGSHARGQGAVGDDYDLLIVSPAFTEIAPARRPIGLLDLFYEVGGHAPLDLTCLTPAEFERGRVGHTLVSAVLPEAIDLLAVQEPVSS